MNEIQIVGTIVFVFGAIIGSFLNVCIVRLPHCKSVITPRSHCIHCKKMIPWYDNIPFISYLVLGFRCRFCKERISVRYFIVELVTAGVSLWFYLHFTISALFFAYTIMACGFIVATFVDFEHRIIPDEISVGGMVVGLIFSLFVPALHGISTAIPGIKPYILSFGQSLLGVLIGGGAIYLMGLLGDLIFKKESMGGGDVKLLAMIGAFMGWKMALLTFFIAPFFGAVYGIVEKIRTKDSAIAYGPFLVLGAIISLFYGDRLFEWFITGYWMYNINL